MAICDATEPTRVEHAKALLEDGGKVSKVTGVILLNQMKKGCEEAEGVPE